MVVQPRAPQLGLVQVEAQRLDQVQTRPGHRGETDRVAGVPRDARLEEHHVGQGRRRSCSRVGDVRPPVGAGVGDLAHAPDSRSAAREVRPREVEP
ncbi:hypothetical protein IU11_17555 [Cellulosimicrobium sp. MM]|nr:hypothetical protein IU11_17555 [Cellulosimicrobium sp. MM]